MPLGASPSDARTCAACRATLAAGAATCPECGAAIVAAAPYPPFLSLPHMRYPDAYAWLVLVATLDIILTYLVLTFWGGYEVNPVAQAVITQMGFTWAILFKYALVLLAIILCDVVGRLRERDGRRLSIAFVVIAALPVAYTFLLLLTHQEDIRL